MDIYIEFTELLKSLNARKASYAVCGGFAVAFHGYVRATKDIDLLVQLNDLDSVLAIAKECGFDPCDDFLRFGMNSTRRRRQEFGQNHELNSSNVDSDMSPIAIQKRLETVGQLSRLANYLAKGIILRKVVGSIGDNGLSSSMDPSTSQ